MLSAKPLVIHNPNHHTMHNSLFGYLDLKIHESIRNNKFERIIVTGDYQRNYGISLLEKSNKRFNWQRPTIVEKETTLYVCCFPGYDYVKHYASLIATYLALHDKEWNKVHYQLPDETTCWQALINVKVLDIPLGDIAILGSGLEFLSNTCKKSWQRKGAFSWKQETMDNQKIVYIGFTYSYWGDISGRIVTYLAQKGFKKILYIGKLGTLIPDIPPNVHLATGNCSYIEGELIHWENLFDFAHMLPEVIFGDHVSCPSTIYETKEWLKKHKEYHFVDPEIGHIARAARSSGINFSYLHIISDNIVTKYTEDLSNERQISIVNKRNNLLRIIKKALSHLLTAQKILVLFLVFSTFSMEQSTANYIEVLPIDVLIEHILQPLILQEKSPEKAVHALYGVIRAYKKIYNNKSLHEHIIKLIHQRFEDDVCLITTLFNTPAGDEWFSKTTAQLPNYITTEEEFNKGIDIFFPKRTFTIPLPLVCQIEMMQTLLKRYCSSPKFMRNETQSLPLILNMLGPIKDSDHQQHIPNINNYPKMLRTPYHIIGYYKALKGDLTRITFDSDEILGISTLPNTTIRAYISALKAKANTYDIMEGTPLHTTVKFKNVRTTRILLEEFGADAKAIDKNGTTPLSLARDHTTTEILPLLLQHTKKTRVSKKKS